MPTAVNTTIVPGHGTIFLAAKNTAMPAGGLSAFGLATTPSGWDNIGHTSKDNLPAFKKTGGDSTVLDSFLQDAIDTIYASSSWALGINPIQIDANSLGLAFGGNFDTDGGYIIPSSNNGIAKAMFLYMTDGTGALGFYMPNSLVSLGDAPTIDVTKFLELPLSSSIQSADPSVIPAAANGLAGIMKLYKSTLAAAVPTISAVTPTAPVPATGAQIKISGTGFTGVTGAAAVKVGGSNVTSYEVFGDTEIFAVMPSGSAGSTTAVVTNSVGPSTGFTFTRAA